MKTPRIPPSIRIFLAATVTAVPTGGTRVHAEQASESAKAFTNSLGMKMVPVKATPGVLWCVWETRNSDFEAYLADRGPGRRKRWFEQGADPNKKTVEGITPLMLASCGKSAAMVRTLLEGGANPDTPSPGPWFGAELTLTPLHGAVASGSVDMVLALLQGKANPNAFDNMGSTPLINAAGISRVIEMKSYQGSGSALDKVRLLLEHGAKPSLGAKGQMPRFTALHAAATAGDFEVIRLLAGKGADLSATCGDSFSSPGISGKTPRELAEMSNQWAAAKLLRELDRADR